MRVNYQAQMNQLLGASAAALAAGSFAVRQTPGWQRWSQGRETQRQLKTFSKLQDVALESANKTINNEKNNITPETYDKISGDLADWTEAQESSRELAKQNYFVNPSEKTRQQYKDLSEQLEEGNKAISEIEEIANRPTENAKEIQEFNAMTEDAEAPKVDEERLKNLATGKRDIDVLSNTYDALMDKEEEAAAAKAYQKYINNQTFYAQDKDARHQRLEMLKKKYKLKEVNK